MLIALALLLLAGSAAWVLGLTLVAQERDHAIAHRVNLIAHAPSRRPAAIAAEVWQQRVTGGMRALFAFGMRRRWGISINSVYLLAAGIGAAASILLLGGWALHLWGYILFITAVGGFFLLPRGLLITEQRRTEAKFAELLPDAIDMVVRIVRAGLPVSAAIRTVGQEATKPLSAVFAEVADQAEIGLPLDEALAKTSAAIGNSDFRFFAVAVALQQSTGGNLAETLETLSQIIRKRRAVRLKAGAATAEVRLSAIVLGAIPFFVTGALLLVAPAYLDPLIADPRGNVILGLALLGLVLAGVTMRAMIRRSLSL